MFDRANELHASGKTFGDIAGEIGIGRRTLAKWIRAGVLPHRRRMALKPSSPLYFQDFLARRWAEGDKAGRLLFQDVKRRGYTGSFSYLERLPPARRRASRGETAEPDAPAEESRAADPATGWQISPVAAASLGMKPTPMLAPAQAVKAAALTKASPSFVVMRRLAMRFRGVLRGDDSGKLSRWLSAAPRSGISSLQQFAPTLSRDIDAARNAIAEQRSSGQAEGQINRLKTLKRAMYGRASVELLRATMPPFEFDCEHGK